MGTIKIAVTGTGSLIGQAIIKSIAASSFKNHVGLIGFDYFKDTPGSFWVKKNYILPDILKPDVRKEDWLDCLMNVLESEKVDYLFPGLDFELGILSKNRKLIKEKTGCNVLVSEPDVINIADDKYLTYKFLKENGFYYPRTLLKEQLAGMDIEFPCFIKPRSSYRSRDAHIVKTKEALLELSNRICNPVIQELVGNPDTEYTCGTVTLEGDVRYSIVLRRYLKDGNTHTAYFDRNTPNIIYEYINAVSAKLKPYGACNFQLRMDKDNTPKIFEINARHSGTTYIRSLFGFNEVERILSYLTGKSIQKFKLREGKVVRYFDEMFISA